MAEQLLFTWADRGLEGRGMWQIVAATEHLFLRLPKVCQQARDLCTEFAYPPLWQDPATAPVSFGWRDIRGLRYAFRRVYRGTDHFGRPGVFAAHVLVDRPERLPADSLLATAHSPSWWAGDPLTTGDSEWLPPVALDAFEHTGKSCADDDVTTAVLTAVLAHRGRPVLLALDAALVIDALQRVSTLLPGLLDELGVSTYEPSATRAHFGLAAAQPPDDDPRAITVEALLDAAAVSIQRNVARLTVSDDPALSAYARRAWEGAQGAQQPAREVFLSVCSGFLALRGSTAPTMDDLLPALRLPNTAADLLDDLRARTVVAQALGTGEARTVTALRTVGGTLDPETWGSLGELTARAATTTAGLAVAMQTLRAMTVTGFEAFVAELVRLALDDPSQVLRWPMELLPHACTRAEVRRTAALKKAVVSFGAPHLRRLATSVSMPADLWSLMLDEALRTGAVDAESAARAVMANEAFTRAVGRGVSASALEALLDALPATQAAALLRTWAASGRAALWVDLANRAARRLGDGEAWQAAEAIHRCLRHPVPAGWPELRDRVVRRRLAYELGNVRSQPYSLAAFYQPGAGSDDRAWYEYLRLLRGGEIPSSWPRHAMALAARVDGLPKQHQELASRYALQDAVARTTAEEEVAVIVQALAPRLGEDLEQVAELVLYGGLRATVARRRPESGRAALAYVSVWLVEPDAVPRRKLTGELCRRSAQDLAAQLYTELAIRDRHLDERWQGWVRGRPRAERWLRGLRG